uniref:C2H2-type domain-containing protein n=1 Tax=Plectus sambesii TaxID=2011161 RepID=A0A914UVV8_9BILA
RHMQSVHRANKPVKNTSDFDCSMCGKTFRYLSHLQRHQLTHLEMREHACPLCKQTFVQKDHLKRHLAAKHSDGQSTKQFPCPRCQREKAFPTQWELQRHLDSVHPTLLTCTQCDDSFIFETQEAWQSHKETHTGRRQFQCDRCGRGFHQRCDLDAHTAAHDRLGRFQCVACELAFVQRVQVRCIAFLGKQL